MDSRLDFSAFVLSVRCAKMVSLPVYVVGANILLWWRVSLATIYLNSCAFIVAWWFDGLLASRFWHSVLCRFISHFVVEEFTLHTMWEKLMTSRAIETTTSYINSESHSIRHEWITQQLFQHWKTFRKSIYIHKYRNQGFSMI